VFQALSSFYGIGYLTSRDTKGAFTTSVYGGLITIVISFLLIPSYQLFGAATAVMLGYLTMFVGRMIQTRKYFSIVFPYKFFLYMVLLIAITAAADLIDNNVIHFLTIFMTIVISILINKELLTGFLPRIKNHIIHR